MSLVTDNYEQLDKKMTKISSFQFLKLKFDGKHGECIGEGPVLLKVNRWNVLSNDRENLAFCKISQAPPSQILHVVYRKSPIHLWCYLPVHSMH